MHAKGRDGQTTQPYLPPEGLPRWDGPLSHPLYSKVIKRVLDFLFALVLLLPAALIMAPIALAVKLTSEGPVFYRALRGGYHNRPFNILKFRTMVVGADKYSGTTAPQRPAGDPRRARAAPHQAGRAASAF